MRLCVVWYSHDGVGRKLYLCVVYLYMWEVSCDIDIPDFAVVECRI